MGLDEVTLRLVTGAIIGLLIGLTGVGGGVLVVPVLQLLFRFDPVSSVATASMVACMSQALTAYGHSRRGNVRWKATWWFLGGALPCSMLVASTLAAYAKEPAVQTVVAVLVLAAMVVSLLGIAFGVKPRAKGDCSEPSLDPRRLRRGLWAGAVVGLVVGATSIGGGVLIIPSMLIVMGLSLRSVVGSAAAAAAALTCATAVAYLIGGRGDLATAGLLVLGAIGGTQLGSSLACKASEQVLRRLIITMVCTAIAGASLATWRQAQVHKAADQQHAAQPAGLSQAP